MNDKIFNIENAHSTMCWKTWNDLIISLPSKRVKWCCKTTQTTEQQQQATFDEHTLSVDFLTNHPILTQRKKELAGGIQSLDCEYCWANEHKSGDSVRTFYNKNNHSTEWHLLQFPNKARENFDTATRDGTRFIEFELTNRCNMACMYCWEGLSSRWQKEMKNPFPDTEDVIFDKSLEVLTEYYNTHLHNNDRTIISLLGGEPFFTDHIFRFSEDFLYNINDNIPQDKELAVVLTTNLNFSSPKIIERFTEILKHTQNVHWVLQISVEAIGNKSEMIRWGKNWDLFDSTLDKFYTLSKKYPNLTLGYGSAHNSLSIPYIRELYEYIKKKEIQHNYDKYIHFHTNWVDVPSHMGVALVDKSFAPMVDDAIEYFKQNFDNEKRYNTNEHLETLIKIRNIVDSDVSDNDKERAREQFDIVAKRRNINFQDVFPHFDSMINNT